MCLLDEQVAWPWCPPSSRTLRCGEWTWRARARLSQLPGHPLWPCMAPAGLSTKSVHRFQETLPKSPHFPLQPPSIQVSAHLLSLCFRSNQRNRHSTGLTRHFLRQSCFAKETQSPHCLRYFRHTRLAMKPVLKISAPHLGYFDVDKPKNPACRSF